MSTLNCIALCTVSASPPICSVFCLKALPQGRKDALHHRSPIGTEQPKSPVCAGIKDAKKQYQDKLDKKLTVAKHKIQHSSGYCLTRKAQTASLALN